MNFFKRIFIWMFCILLGLAGILVMFAPYLYAFTKAKPAGETISGFGVITSLWWEGIAGPMSAVLQILVVITAGGILLIGLIGLIREFLFRPIPEIKKGGVILAISYTILSLVLMIFLLILCMNTSGQASYYEMGIGSYIAVGVGALIVLLLLILIRVLGDTSVWSRQARVISQTTAYGNGEFPTAFGQPPAPMMLNSYSYGQMPQSTAYNQSVSYGQAPPPISYVAQLPPPASTTTNNTTNTTNYIQALPAPQSAQSYAASQVMVPAPEKKKEKQQSSKNHVVDSTVSFRFIEGMSENQIRTAVEDLFAKAHRGESDAQFRLGICYQNGTGVPQNLSTAADWQTKASAQGHAQAKFVLGEYYVEGKGVPRKIVEGITLIKESARKGFVGAQMRLGNYYQNGEYLPRDYDKAVQWYTQAAEQGNAFSIQALKSFAKGADGKWHMI